MNRVIQSLVVAGMLMPAALFAQSSQMSSAEMDKLFKEGVACAEAEDYGKAVEIFQKLANQGHAKAQLYLGACYAIGAGVPKDMQKAEYLFEKSAQDAETQFYLGMCYLKGNGVPKDMQKAKYWLQKAADQGHRKARMELKILSEDSSPKSSQVSSAEMDKLFSEGKACCEAEDYGKAVEIFQKLANQGHAEAQCYLGMCYAGGVGVPKDLQKAKYWLQKAADQGYGKARYALEELSKDSSVFSEQYTRYEKLAKMHRDRLNNARIDIAGIVTDTDGVKLKDVDLHINFSRPKDVWATHSEDLDETMKINGSFSIRKEHYTSVSISFLKEGYYPERITLYTSKKADESDSAIQTHFHVKLRKIGALADLIRFKKPIQYDLESNNQSVCNLSKLAEGQLNNKIIPLGNTIPLQKYVYLDFERDKQDAIIYGKKGRGNNSPAPKTYFLRLVSPDQADGFILVEEPIKDLTYLTEAPPDGYTKELVIPYENDRRYYFYIRCGDFYGKGVIWDIGATCDNYDLLVEMFFNLEAGDVNLRSLKRY